MKNQIVLASGNEHKASELREILPQYEILTMFEAGFKDEIIEDGTSFEENALIKARAVHGFCGKTVIADDSGLCVNALDGAPGVYSARYGGINTTDKKNNLRLLENMRGIPAHARGAVFVSAAAVVFEDGTQAVTRGEVRGFIAFDEAGANGFGYDPLFICAETNTRYAEMTPEQKNRISHRKRAFEKLRVILLNHTEKKQI